MYFIESSHDDDNNNLSLFFHKRNVLQKHKSRKGVQ